MKPNSLYTNYHLALFSMCLEFLLPGNWANKQKDPHGKAGWVGGRGREYVYRSVCLANKERWKVCEKNQTSGVAMPNVARKEIRYLPKTFLGLFWNFWCTNKWQSEHREVSCEQKCNASPLQMGVTLLWEPRPLKWSRQYREVCSHLLSCGFWLGSLQSQSSSHLLYNGRAWLTNN